MTMELATMRKAITAAVLGCLFALATAVVEGDAPHDVGGWLGLATMSVASGVLAGVAVYRVTNVGSVNGSYPPAAARGYDGPRYAAGRSDGTMNRPGYGLTRETRRPPSDPV